MQLLPLLVLIFTISPLSLTSAQIPPDSGSLQACDNCLTTAAIAQSPSCATISHFSALNLTSSNNATQEEKTCICGLTKDENQFWLRACIAKPPAACTGQGNATSVVYEVLDSYRSVCPTANATATFPSPGEATNPTKNNDGTGSIISAGSPSLLTVVTISFLAGMMSLAVL